MPIIRLVPVQSDDDDDEKEEDVKSFTCPLFQNAERSGDDNFIIDMDLPTELPPEHWILTGTALLCQRPIEQGGAFSSQTE